MSQSQSYQIKPHRITTRSKERDGHETKTKYILQIWKQCPKRNRAFGYYHSLLIGLSLLNFSRGFLSKETKSKLKVISNWRIKVNLLLTNKYKQKLVWENCSATRKAYFPNSQLWCNQEGKWQRKDFSATTEKPVMHKADHAQHRTFESKCGTSK